MGEEEDIEEEYEDIGLTQVQKKAMNTEKLFNEKTKKDKIMETRAKELKALRERLMAGTRDSVMDSFDELNHRKVKKTEVDVRSENAKKFMAMFDKGEIPEGMSASDRITLEKDAELQMMRTRERGERDFSKKFSFFEKGGGENGKKESEPVTSERLHAAKECKASSVINKFKDLEKRAANER